MTTRASRDKAAVLLDLHKGPGFVLPNAWDSGSARILEQVGFPAIATTSAGIAWSLGVPDGMVDRETMLEVVGRIVAEVGVPVTADLEAGYGATADEVGATVARAAALGAVGANIEDARPDGLYGLEEAADRIAAARVAAPKGTFVLNARTDTYFAGDAAADVFDETVERAVGYLDAGADCVFVPGVVEEETIRRLVDAIPGPLNIVAGLASTTDAPTLFSLGVRRVSVGGSLARASLGMVERAGRELLGPGTLDFLDGAIAYPDLQRRFGS